MRVIRRVESLEDEPPQRGPAAFFLIAWSARPAAEENAFSRPAWMPSYSSPDVRLLHASPAEAPQNRHGIRLSGCSRRCFFMTPPHKWSGWEASILRPPAPRAGALPGCATARSCSLIGFGSCRDRSFAQDADLSHAPWPRTTRSEHSHSTLSHDLPTPLRAFVRSVDDPAARRALLRPANLEEHCKPSAPWAPELTPLNAAPHALNVVVSLTHSGSFVQPTRLWREHRPIGTSASTGNPALSRTAPRMTWSAGIGLVFPNAIFPRLLTSRGTRGRRTFAALPAPMPCRATVRSVTRAHVETARRAVEAARSRSAASSFVSRIMTWEDRMAAL